MAKEAHITLARNLSDADARRPRCDVRRSRMSAKGRHAQNFGLAFGYWPCVGGPYIRVQVSSVTLEVWYGIAGQRL